MAPSARALISVKGLAEIPLKYLLNMNTVFKAAIFVSIVLLTGCRTIIAKHELDDLYGSARVRDRVFDKVEVGPDYYTAVKPILEQRCVVCHACYDAPCQLKLSSIEGIDRGANKKEVYSGTRLLAAQPSRLYIDADNTSQWRDRSFYPVLNERSQSLEANLAGSVLYRLLEQKRKYPLPKVKVLPETFDFSLNRKQQCPRIEQLDKHVERHPLWGMPYGLPGLEESEFRTIQEWLKYGAKVSAPQPLGKAYEKRIARWEKFLNGVSLKEQLVSRYIYEHLFLAHLYFDDLPKGEFFRLVRSSTPPGKPIRMIATRRPYEAPSTDGVVYYRLWHERSTVTVKTHMPYALGEKRLKRWQELFFDRPYEVHNLPSYAPEVAANPFVAFQDIPVKSRYEFMLDEAEFSIMGFIKGPVCRGNTALNVIQDRFWVMFISPDAIENKHLNEFLVRESRDLLLPSAESSNSLVLSTWLKYSEKQEAYLKSKKVFLRKLFSGPQRIDLDLIWDGGPDANTNAALSVFRHLDAATVVKGFVGETPKTAWLIGYPLLERLHYLLVAGFDVYGNIGHQLNSRLFMDFLRMEGEQDFLLLLPKGVREAERDFWYRDVASHVANYINWPEAETISEPSIEYVTDDPKEELFELLRERLDRALSQKYSLSRVRAEYQVQLRRLQTLDGAHVQYLPQLSYLRLRHGSSSMVYSIVHDNSYTNVSTPFFEEYRRRPYEDRLTVVPGVLGAYPNSFFDVDVLELNSFVNDISKLRSDSAYSALVDRYGVRRTSDKFWPYLDWLHQEFQAIDPMEAGLLDLNRFENR